jgi:hypothetical protein
MKQWRNDLVLNLFNGSFSAEEVKLQRQMKGTYE